MDEFNQTFPALKTDDLLPRDGNLPIRLSILMSINNFRRGQLARSLECLCRQSWREFEVLVCDNGGPENLKEVFDIFHPFLDLRTVRLEASGFSACPSRGFRELIPMARGEVIAIMQPEVMLLPSVTFYLHDAHFNDWPNTHSYKIAINQFSARRSPRWVIPKVGFFDKATFGALDGIDWHSNLRNVEGLPEFMTHSKGFSYATNHLVIRKREYPWWFVASALRDANIWRDMPVFKVHATIDQWLLSHRRRYDYLDICTRELTGYHQWHFRGQQETGSGTEAVIPAPVLTKEETAWRLPLEIDELREMCRSYGVPVSDDQDFDTLWGLLQQARVADQDVHHRQ
jgi:glycosyltransferase involved in cell wall biosynthesis